MGTKVLSCSGLNKIGFESIESMLEISLAKKERA